jgi:hypothetical protein
VVTTLLGAGLEPEPTDPVTGEVDGVRWARHRLAGPGWLQVTLGGVS